MGKTVHLKTDVSCRWHSLKHTVFYQFVKLILARSCKIKFFRFKSDRISVLKTESAIKITRFKATAWPDFFYCVTCFNVRCFCHCASEITWFSLDCCSACLYSTWSRLIGNPFIYLHVLGNKYLKTDSKFERSEALGTFLHLTASLSGHFAQIFSYFRKVFIIGVIRASFFWVETFRC